MFQKISRIKEKIFRDNLLKAILIISSGTVIAQIISILAMPVITRLYTPDDFGILAIFTATTTLLVIAGGLRYDSALPLPKSDEDAANLFVLFLLILSISTVILILIFPYVSELLFTTLHRESLNVYGIFLIIAFFSVSVYRALTYWVTRRRDYPRITTTKITQGLGGSASKIILGLLSFGPLGLIIGHIISQAMGCGNLMKFMWKKDRILFQKISVSQMKKVGADYIQFPLFSCPAAFFNTLALQMPVFMLTTIYGLEVTGMYSLAYSLLIFSGSLISTSMAQAYYAEVSHMMRENSKDLKKTYINTTRTLLKIGIPLFFIPCVLAPFLFPVIFGSVWKDAGYYCLPLFFMAVSQFVISPTSNLGGYGFNHWQLAWDISRVILVFGVFWIVQSLTYSIMWALFIYSMGMTCMYGVLYLMNIKSIDCLIEKELYK